MAHVIIFYCLGRGVPLFFAVSAFSLAYGYFGRLGDRAQQREFYLRYNVDVGAAQLLNRADALALTERIKL